MTSASLADKAINRRSWQYTDSELATLLTHSQGGCKGCHCHDCKSCYPESINRSCGHHSVLQTGCEECFPPSKHSDISTAKKRWGWWLAVFTTAGRVMITTYAVISVLTWPLAAVIPIAISSFIALYYVYRDDIPKTLKHLSDLWRLLKSFWYHNKTPDAPEKPAFNGWNCFFLLGSFVFSLGTGVLLSIIGFTHAKMIFLLIPALAASGPAAPIVLAAIIAVAMGIGFTSNMWCTVYKLAEYLAKAGVSGVVNDLKEFFKHGLIAPAGKNKGLARARFIIKWLIILAGAATAVMATFGVVGAWKKAFDKIPHAAGAASIVMVFVLSLPIRLIFCIKSAKVTFGDLAEKFFKLLSRIKMFFCSPSVAYQAFKKWKAPYRRFQLLGAGLVVLASVVVHVVMLAVLALNGTANSALGAESQVGGIIDFSRTQLIVTAFISSFAVCFRFIFARSRQWNKFIDDLKAYIRVSEDQMETPKRETHIQDIKPPTHCAIGPSQVKQLKIQSLEEWLEHENKNRYPLYKTTVDARWGVLNQRTVCDDNGFAKPIDEGALKKADEAYQAARKSYWNVLENLGCAIQMARRWQLSTRKRDALHEIASQLGIPVKSLHPDISWGKSPVLNVMSAKPAFPALPAFLTDILKLPTRLWWRVMGVKNAVVTPLPKRGAAPAAAVQSQPSLSFRARCRLLVNRFQRYWFFPDGIQHRIVTRCMAVLHYWVARLRGEVCPTESPGLPLPPRRNTQPVAPGGHREAPPNNGGSWFGSRRGSTDSVSFEVLQRKVKTMG